MCASVSNLYNIYNNNYNNNCLSIFFSTYNLSASNNAYPLDLYSGDLQTTSVLFTHNASSHKTDWITTARCLLCLGFLYSYKNSLTKRSSSRMFMFSLSRELCRIFIVVCIFCSHCLLLLSFSYLSPFLILMLLLVYL